MASNRHLGRIIVLQSLYEYEFRTKAGDATVDIDTIVAKDIEPYQKALGDTEFVYGLARAISGKFAELDAELQPMAPEWMRFCNRWRRNGRLIRLLQSIAISCV